MINFHDGECKISGHIGLGPVPTLMCGTWNGQSLDEVSEEELSAIISTLLVLIERKFRNGS
jgi:hypothetical protein